MDMTALLSKLTNQTRRPLPQILAVAVVALLAYSNSLHVPFVFDDESSIVRNSVIHSLSNYLINGSGYELLPNRSIGYLTFALNYHFGGLNVVGYHVVNLLIHIMNALLVYALVRLTMRTPFFGGQGTGDWGLERQGLGTGGWGLTTQNSKLKTFYHSSLPSSSFPTPSRPRQ
jgi:hypothetical protein